jgi:hypothetical protein
VRDQLNRGIVPDGVDLHCLAGLMKVCSSVTFDFFSFLLHRLCFINVTNFCIYALAVSLSKILVYRLFKYVH